MQEFSNSLRAWQSKRPAINLSQQEEIEELTKKLEDQARSHKEQLEATERAHSNQLQEIKAGSRQEKEKLERLQAANKLEESERSHNQQLKELEAASQKEKEELKQSLQSEIRQLEQQLADERAYTQKLEKLEKIKREKDQAQHFIEDLGNSIKFRNDCYPWR
ncbi:MAG: hypothetical protein QNJ55_31925 [Xenococcus sp. MO_188.B8]|nr:hypothetical protein [Xenococcus sp. MO_188.B8]